MNMTNQEVCTLLSAMCDAGYPDDEFQVKTNKGKKVSISTMSVIKPEYAAESFVLFFGTEAPE